MYKKHDGQITIAEFYSPFGQLDKNNRWVVIADQIPWKKFEEKYAARFCDNNGAPAIKFRMAMGTLIIKQMTGHSDDGVLQDILENPYMQYLIGLHEFTTSPPFAQSSITNFRRYISKDIINEANEYIFKPGPAKPDKHGDDPGDGNGGGSGPGTTDPGNQSAAGAAPNKGSILLDATCAPADITYPTDIKLLNEAREKLEGMVDTLYAHANIEPEPRTYRKVARRDYMRFSKQRKPRKKTIRKAIKQQLQYVKRDLGHVDRLVGLVGSKLLSRLQQEWLETVKERYRQQQLMYDSKSHSIEDRIVSISQPHVRPIVRGKADAAVEFGAKISASMIDGFAFIDRIGWDAFNEEALLIPTIESYKEGYGCYPEAVLADKIYRNRDNLAYCKKHGIRLSGPRLGRPPKEKDKSIIRKERLDSSNRNAIEGKFGEGKNGYGLGRVMARLQDSSETVIAMTFFCMNLRRRLRVLLRYFYDFVIKQYFENYVVGKIISAGF